MKTCITDKQAKIETFIHYSDHRAKGGVTTFGEPSDECCYNYSDRLPDWEKHLDVARKQGLDRHTAKFYEVALSSFHGKPVDLRHIVCGANAYNGFPWMCFWYVMEGK